MVGAVIAIGLVVFQSDEDGGSGPGVVASSTPEIEAPLEIAPENPDPNNPGSDFTGGDPFGQITGTGPDPVFLAQQLELAGVEVPEGATTEELEALLIDAMAKGFRGYAP